MWELADIRKIRCLGGNSHAKVAVTIRHGLVYWYIGILLGILLKPGKVRTFA